MKQWWARHGARIVDRICLCGAILSAALAVGTLGLIGIVLVH
jgi:uncharacterized RDD family membrane protein YckC